jgi:hypothetical protein
MQYLLVVSRFFTLYFVLNWVLFLPAYAQSPGLNDELKQLVQAFKKDDRGPYQAIRWFCPDGSMVTPPDRCTETGGIMHALPKDLVKEMAKNHNIHLGQILAGTALEDFWDAAHQQSRLKQYQLEKFLQAADDGWILRRARYYRGAVQAEDEEKWGRQFLIDRLTDNEIIDSYYFLLRQSVKDIPHLAANDKRWENIRVNSKTIADRFPGFFNLRVKLHGQPEPSDLPKVKEFKAQNKDKLGVELSGLVDTLIADLEIAYQPVNLQMLGKFLNSIPDDLPLKAAVKKLSTSSAPGNRPGVYDEISDLMWQIRKNLAVPSKGVSRLVLLDLSLVLEKIIFTWANSWQPAAVGEILEKNYILAKAAAACGFLETWEWETAEPLLKPAKDQQELTFAEFSRKADYARRLVDWGTGMFRAEYNDVVSLFGGFESLAYGFIDDRVRSSLLLPLGNTAARLWDIASEMSGTSNQVMNIRNQNQVRGLNPGFALGELAVIAGIPKEMDWSSKKIYVLEHAPADIKPVAGIMAVSEGNLVSHVQLLARNLGIPNAAISLQNFNDLKAFSGQVVFYAVSPAGVVVVKTVSQLTPGGRALVEEKKRPEEKVTVPIHRIDWQAGLKRLSDLRAVDSGRICGPKAANLGQLKFLFPDQVVEGLVIPFAVFRDHMDQQMPGGDLTYWGYLNQTFKTAAQERQQGKSDEEVGKIILERLAILRESIRSMPFLSEFAQQLGSRFQDIFGVPMGQLPVFVRSDTNMEDLKDFTGAGLNLTVFNVLETDKILQGIRDVWASPYSERSYLWRQKYLENPENVFPSILLLPSVNVDKSGVMITTGVTTSRSEDITIAFSRGVGGAVEGQAAETYVISDEPESLLISPAREMRYTVLPVTGGTEKAYSRLNRRLLSTADLHQLRILAATIKQRLPGTPGIQGSGPFDIELGFKDSKIWLFQVRPYVENKRARSSMYLKSLDPEPPMGIKIPLDKKIQ